MMFFLTPSVGWSLPLLWPIILAAAAAKGYSVLKEQTHDAQTNELTRQLMEMRLIQLPLDEVLKQAVEDEVKHEEVLRFTDGKVVIAFKRNIRGKFVVEAMAPKTMPMRELELRAQAFAAEIAQRFALSRIAVEMEKRGATAIEEELQENGDIVIKMRRWD
jgi:hypothetical protein